MNTSSLCFFKEPEWSPVLGIVLFVEFIPGFIGNCVVLWVFCFCIRFWNTSTLYLFNVSLADLLLIAGLPFRGEYLLRGKEWTFGDIPCRIMLFMFSLNRTGSIFFLTLVVVNRYFMIVHPHHRINMMKTIPWGLVITVSLWGIVILLNVYVLSTSHLLTGEITNKTLCESFDMNWNGSGIIIWHYVFFVLQLIVPLFIIFLCTIGIVRQLKRHKDKRGKIERTIKSMIFVAFVFIFCFFPCTVCTILVVISKHLTMCKLFNLSSLAFAASLTLTYFNSVLNPLAIYISSTAFQAVVNCTCNFCKKPKHNKNKHQC